MLMLAFTEILLFDTQPSIYPVFISVTGQSKVRSANKQVDFFCFKGNLPAGNYFSYG